MSGKIILMVALFAGCGAGDSVRHTAPVPAKPDTSPSAADAMRAKVRALRARIVELETENRQLVAMNDDLSETIANFRMREWKPRTTPAAQPPRMPNIFPPTPTPTPTDESHWCSEDTISHSGAACFLGKPACEAYRERIKTTGGYKFSKECYSVEAVACVSATDVVRGAVVFCSPSMSGCQEFRRSHILKSKADYTAVGRCEVRRE